MKYLLVLVVLTVAWAWWRSNRRDSSQDQRPPMSNGGSPGRQATTAAPVEMVACAHCGVHVPAGDAVRGHKGRYCGRPHLLVAEPEHGA